MADYLTPTVVQQTIPLADMTPLERLILTNVFESGEKASISFRRSASTTRSISTQKRLSAQRTSQANATVTSPNTR